MSLDHRYLVNLLFSTIKKVEERCPGYQEELQKIIIEIVSLEREHYTRRISIKQKIAERCSRVGVFLDRSVKEKIS